jgi:hypothetical protein
MITAQDLLVRIKRQVLLVMLVALLGAVALTSPGLASVTCDLKGTGNVTAVDALMVLQMAVGLDSVTPAASTCCNSYGDTQITASCALIVLREAVGLPITALTSIAVTPAKPSITVGTNQQFTATGTYSDNSTQNLTNSVTWSSSNTSVSTITTGGFVIATTTGSTTITATSGSISGTTTLTATAASFSQSDLKGTWNVIYFASSPGVTAGTDAGWMHENATIDASGNVTVNSISNSLGNATAPAAGTLVETINANGVITESGANGLGTGNETVMSANKMIAVGTASNGSDRIMRIFVKQVPGVTFSNADISSFPLVVSELETGANNYWEFVQGTINAAQQLTSTSDITNIGVQPLITGPILAVTSTGIVTTTGVNGNPSFQGVMTADKKLIISTETNSSGTSYKFSIVSVGAQNFTAADLAGTWRYHELVTYPAWDYGTSSNSPAGVVTPLTYLDSIGSTTVPPSFTDSLSLAGLLTVTSDSTVYGFMSFDKNLIVSTRTLSSGSFDMDVSLR